MFPNLRTLMLANNELFAWSPDTTPPPAGRPAILPGSWTQSSYPVAFPAMAQLALFPGNENICSLPNTTNFQLYGYSDLNPGERVRCFPVHDVLHLMAENAARHMLEK